MKANVCVLQFERAGKFNENVEKAIYFEKADLEETNI